MQAEIDGALDLQDAALSTAGTLTLSSLNGATETTLAAGARITAGMLYAFSDTISIDPTSSFEVGTAGHAALGAFTIDSGDLAYLGTDTIFGGLVNNGEVDLYTADVLNGPVAGRGADSSRLSRFQI